MRNTTTATPEVNGTSVSSPAGQAWTGAFASPIEDAFAPPAGTTESDQTVRIALAPNVAVPAGSSQVRIRLSNPGFLSGDGTGALNIGAATIDLQAIDGSNGAEPAQAQAPVPLTFHGAASVTVPEGGDVYSDPLTLPFAVTTTRNLLVSLWITNTTLPGLPLNSFASGALAWFSPAGSGNDTADTTGTPFTGTGSRLVGAVPLLTGLDVTTPAVSSGGVTTSPGQPTVVVAGDNVIDGYTSDALSDALHDPSQRLAGQLVSQKLAAGYGVVDAGVEANQVMSDGSSYGGVSLLARLDRDILAEPDVGTVIIDEGLQDLLRDASSSTSSTADLAEGNLEDAYQALESQLHAFGINVIIATLTPCAGYTGSSLSDSCTTGAGVTVDASRQDVNSTTIDDTPVPYCYADFDAAVSNGASPEALASDDNAGDGVNLTLGGPTSGYGVLAPAVFSSSDACSLLPESCLHSPPSRNPTAACLKGHLPWPGHQLRFRGAPQPPRPRAPGRALAACAATALVLPLLTGMTGPPGGTDGGGRPGSGRSRPPKPVPVHPVRSSRVPVPAMQSWHRPAVSWPSASTAAARLPAAAATAGPAAVRFTGLGQRRSAGQRADGRAVGGLGPGGVAAGLGRPGGRRPPRPGRAPPPRPRLAQVRVAMASRQAAAAAGVSGVIFTVSRADGQSAAAGLHVSLDYRSFAYADGGDYAARLHLVELPACALTTPRVASCRAQTPLASADDVATDQLGANVTLPAASALQPSPPWCWRPPARSPSGSGGGATRRPLCRKQARGPRAVRAARSPTPTRSASPRSPAAWPRRSAWTTTPRRWTA